VTTHLPVATICRIGDADSNAHERRSAEAGVADREVAGRLMAGDPDALAEVYRRYVGLVAGIARRVVNDRSVAEDVTQEVFTYLWQHPERFNPSRGALRSWLGVLAHRRAIDRVRAESRRNKGEKFCEPSAPIVGEADHYLAATWLAGRVGEALAQLPAEQRQVVVLAYYGDRSYRQVADELDLPEGTVKSRVRLALKKLDTLLRAEFTDQDEPVWT
jgi:RNA polymerase sigma factor (sigma-70 family)